MKDLNQKQTSVLCLAILSGQEQSRGASARLAEGLCLKALKEAVLDASLQEIGDDVKRAAVEQAIRQHLGRITGKVDKDNKPLSVKTASGEEIPAMPKMSISRRNSKKEDKTLHFVVAGSTGGAGGGNQPKTGEGAATTGNSNGGLGQVTEMPEMQEWHKAITGSVTLFCGKASLAEREALCKTLMVIFTVDGKLFINAPEVKMEWPPENRANVVIPEATKGRKAPTVQQAA